MLIYLLKMPKKRTRNYVSFRAGGDSRMDYKKYIAGKINIVGASAEEIASCITVPPAGDMGDFALPCFRFAKILRKPPAAIAEDVKNSFVTDSVVCGVSAVNGYLNFKIDRSAFVTETLKKIAAEGDKYGASDIGKGKTICIDYSSINIAKPFHIGHLSTTVLGGALYRILSFLGYKTVGINHLGDYGTQFGKLISAYKRWGDKETVQKGGIRALNELYVRFHREAEEHPEYDDEARAYFKKIEEKDAATIKKAIADKIETEPLAKIDYVDVVDFATITPIDQIAGETLVAIAVYIGKTRLIDNFIVEA